MIAFLWNLTLGLVKLYLVVADIPLNPMTQEALHPKEWWHPVFHLVIVTFIAILTLSRLSRNNTFWISAAVFILLVLLLQIILLSICATQSTQVQV